MSSELAAALIGGTSVLVVGLVAAGGTLVVSFLTRQGTHRQWLLEARQRTYVEVLEAISDTEVTPLSKDGGKAFFVNIFRTANSAMLVASNPVRDRLEALVGEALLGLRGSMSAEALAEHAELLEKAMRADLQAGKK